MIKQIRWHLGANNLLESMSCHVNPARPFVETTGCTAVNGNPFPWAHVLICSSRVRLSGFDLGHDGYSQGIVMVSVLLSYGMIFFFFLNLNDIFKTLNDIYSNINSFKFFLIAAERRFMQFAVIKTVRVMGYGLNQMSWLA